MSRLLIQNYLAELSKLRQVSGTHRESVVREAFKVIDAAPYADISLRLQQRLFKALLFIGVPGELAAAEDETMRSIEIAASNSKSVLGTLNQFAFEVECDIHDGLARSAAELTQRLSDTIVCNPKNIGHPADRVRECFGLAPLDRRWLPSPARMSRTTLLH